jgi:hypothetical protein
LQIDQNFIAPSMFAFDRHFHASALAVSNAVSIIREN